MCVSRSKLFSYKTRNYAIKITIVVLCWSCHDTGTMSHDTNHIVAVPRSCVNEFYSRYHNLVETFYYVTLSENKNIIAKEKPEYVYFNVLFKLNPADGSFDPRELVGRIQVCYQDNQYSLVISTYQRLCDGEQRIYCNLVFLYRRFWTWKATKAWFIEALRNVLIMSSWTDSLFILLISCFLNFLSFTLSTSQGPISKLSCYVSQV